MTYHFLPGDMVRWLLRASCLLSTAGAINQVRYEGPEPIEQGQVEGCHGAGRNDDQRGVGDVFLGRPLHLVELVGDLVRPEAHVFATIEVDDADESDDPAEDQTDGGLAVVLHRCERGKVLA